jgi:LmbE family N-acetylglucosaminyl deacetylase
MIETILAIGAHVGDMELTVGGTLATCAVKGGKIATLALTAGEKGLPKGVDMDKYRNQKCGEAEAFAKMLGGTSQVLDYPDGLLLDNDEVRMQVCDVIRAVKPDLILTHHSLSMHKDHAACYRIVKDAWFYAATPGFVRKYPAHFAKLNFAENWEDANGFNPYIYKEVSKEGFELWQKAVRTHWFVTSANSFPYYEYYCHLKCLRGIEAHKFYAETYMVLPEEQKVIQAL